MDTSDDMARQLNAALDELHAVIDQYEDDPRLLRVYARVALAMYAGRPDGDAVSDWAVGAFQKALARIDPADSKQWAQTQIDCGDAWRAFSIYPCDRDAANAAAVAAYEAAAAAVTPEAEIDVWGQAELKLALGRWLATEWSRREEAGPRIAARLEQAMAVVAEQRPYHSMLWHAPRLIREILVETTDVQRWREAYDRELAVVGKYLDTSAALGRWAEVMDSKACDLRAAAERRKDLWLLTESDKVLEEALAKIDGFTEAVRAALWETSHYLRQNQQRNRELRARMR